MQLTLAHVGARPGSRDELEGLIQGYLGRCSAFARCGTEAFRSEDAMLDWLERQQGRTPALAVLLDSRGRQMTFRGICGVAGCAARRGGPAHCFCRGPGERLVGGGAGAGATAAVAGADDAGPCAGAAGDGRAALPGIYNSDWPSVPRGALRGRSQFGDQRS